MGRRALFELAHSLGFPHPDHLLESMSARQYSELKNFFRLKREEEEEREALAEESRLHQFMTRKIAQQKRDG